MYSIRGIEGIGGIRGIIPREYPNDRISSLSLLLHRRNCECTRGYRGMYRRLYRGVHRGVCRGVYRGVYRGVPLCTMGYIILS